jgi:hypothetical protein
MPEIKNSFIKGKMNQDLDERLIPKGEYRFAQNLSVSESTDADTGALETIKGNVAKTRSFQIKNHFVQGQPELFGSGYAEPECIGFVEDVRNKRVVYFLTNFSGGNDTDEIRNIRRAQGAGSNLVGGTTYSSGIKETCAIVLYNFQTNATHTLTSGSWLNFSTKHIITGARILDDLLFWTDNYNQPRKLNISKAIAEPTHYSIEDSISVAKYAPYAPIRLVNKNGVWAESNTASEDVYADKTSSGITSRYLRDKFVRFSYRYKFEDGEYSLMAPFTQIVFEPLNGGLLKGTENATLDQTKYPNQISGSGSLPVDVHNVFRTTKVNIMQNAINKVILRIPVPNFNERDDDNDYSAGGYLNPYKIDEVEILIKESDSLAIRSLKSIKISEVPDADFEIYSVKPNSTGQTFDRQVLKYVYRSEEPIKVLPEDQLTRVFDQVPLQAKTLEVSGNRVIYGNFVENYPYPTDVSNKRGIDYTLGVDEKGDPEHGQTHGLLQDLDKAYKYHSTKQRRTYQVGIVLADKYGRQSPVILSSNSTNDADTVHTGAITASMANKTITTATGTTSGSSTTITLSVANTDVKAGMRIVGSGVGANVTVSSVTNSTTIVASDAVNLSGVSLTFTHHSWSSNKIAYGQSLKILFNNTDLFNSAKQIHHSEFNAGYNPFGWYSYRVVVKQREQDYYNVYASHPFQGWDNIKNEFNNTTSGGKSWLSLLGDNINKVPRSLKETDFSRDGVMGSEEKLYPKVIYHTGEDEGQSQQQSQLHELIPVVSLGDAFEQNLYLSPEHSGDGSGGFMVYDFLYGHQSNPLIAELPNIKDYMPSGSTSAYNSDVIVAFVKGDTGFNVNGTTDDSLTAILTTNSNTAATVAPPADVDGYTVTGANIKATGKKLEVESYNAGTGEVTFKTKQSLKDGDFLVFNLPQEGLSVFETEPFKSAIDIFYETSTAGLVEDLDDELLDNVIANAPDNFSVTSTTFPENQNTGSILTFSADDNTGSNDLTYGIISAIDGNGVDQYALGKFTINSSTGVVSLSGSFRYENSTRDDINIKYSINDPGSGEVFDTKTVSVTNSNPTFSGSTATESITRTAGANQTVHTDTNCTNGSKLNSEDHLGLTVSHTFLQDSSLDNLFSTTISGNILTVKTTSNWTISNGTSFFTNSEAERTMTITLSDGFGGTATKTLIIDETPVGVQGTLMLPYSQGICNVCNLNSYTYYAISGNNPSNPPTVNADGELTVFAGNFVYTDVTLLNPVTSDYYIFKDYCGTNCYNWRCASIGNQGTPGLVDSISGADDCDDEWE